MLYPTLQNMQLAASRLNLFLAANLSLAQYVTQIFFEKLKQASFQNLQKLDQQIMYFY